MRASRIALLAVLGCFPSAANAAEEVGAKDTKEAAKRAGTGELSKESGPTIEADQLSKQPKLTRPAKVEYPKEALDDSGMGKTGEVEITLLVDLDDKGTVVGASVLEPKTPTGLGFEEAALTAAYDLGFEPAEVAGKPASVQFYYKFKFVPPKPPAPEPPKPLDAGVEKPKPVPVENFTGILLERGTRIPMTGVLVTVYRSDVDGGAPLGFENITDAAGAFHFFDLEPGEWKVRIEPPSYYPFRTNEEIKAGERTQATYYIERGAYNPFDVVVEAKRERKEVSRTVIESAVIEKIPGAMGDPLAVIQNFAGVARAEAGTGFIIVRGSAPADTRFFFDGIQVPVVYHFGGLRSVLPTGMIDSLEFYPGNFSPYYSDATGGVIDLSIKKLKPKKAGGYVDINLLDSGLYLEAPIGKRAAIAVAARRSYVDYIINAALPADAPINALTLPRYYDYQFLANYRPAPAHDLRLFLFGSDDRFEIILKNPGVAGVEVAGNQILWSTTFYRGILTYKYTPTERFENTLRLSQGLDEQRTQIFNFTFNYDIHTTHIRNTSRYQWSDRLAFNAGLDFQYSRVSGLWNLPVPPQEGQSDIDIDLTRVLRQEVSGRNYLWPGVFAELEIRPNKQWLVLPGIRLDYFSYISDVTVAPRFTTRYALDKQWTLKGGAGFFYQQPTIDQSDNIFGSDKLKAQRAIHYSGGVEWRPRKAITIDTTLFHKNLSNMVSSTVANSAATERYDNNGKGRVYGMEFVAKHELTSKFTGWLAYTLMRSERRDSGATDYRLFQYDQTHILTLLGTYRLPRNWQIGGRFRYVTGNPMTPVEGMVYNASTDRYKQVYGATYTDRIPAFHQLDIRIDKLWIYNKWMFNAYVDLQNAYNRTNPEAPQYNYNFQKQTYRQGFPIYPIVGLRGEF